MLEGGQWNKYLFGLLLTRHASTPNNPTNPVYLRTESETYPIINNFSLK